MSAGARRMAVSTLLWHCMNSKKVFTPQELHPVLKEIGNVADANGMEAYAVGGYVRDLLLGHNSSDIDFVTVGSGIELAKALALRFGRPDAVSVFNTYGTAMLNHSGVELEFVGARKESYNRESRNPVVEQGTLDDDQKRRDFTINAMAISINKDTFGELVDPFDGVGDLARKIIRTPLDPDITFSDDPLRMLRAVRFATRLGFRILPETFEAIKRNRDRIRIITKERINDELIKIMGCTRPSLGFCMLDAAGLLEYIIPEISALKGVETKEGRGHKDNFAHTMQVLDNVAAKSSNVWLRWAALFHDVAKPVTKRYDPKIGWTFHNHNFIGEKMIPRIFREMKLPLNDKMKYVARMVGLHMRPQSVGEEGVSDSGVRRLMTEAASDLDDLMTLAEADITSKNPSKVRRQLEGFAQLRERMAEIADADAFRNWKHPLNGNDIRARYSLPEGPEGGMIIQKLKDMVKEAVLDGKIPYTAEASWNFLDDYMKLSPDLNIGEHTT